MASLVGYRYYVLAVPVCRCSKAANGSKVSDVELASEATVASLSLKLRITHKTRGICGAASTTGFDGRPDEWGARRRGVFEL